MAPRLLVALLLIVAGIASYPASPARGERGGSCSDFLVREDAAQSGLDCPELSSIDELGLVRPAPPDEAVKAGVAKVVGGDSFAVVMKDVTYGISLAGVDVPEGADCFAADAAAHLAALMPAASTVYLEPDNPDASEAHPLARFVWLDEGTGGYRLVQEAMVRDGFAIPSTDATNGDYSEFLSLAETSAEAHGRGIWGACNGATPSIANTPATGDRLGITGQTNCDPAYPTVCIPDTGNDLDCGDIPYTWFEVGSDDPDHFDADHDGYGCEQPPEP